MLMAVCTRMAPSGECGTVRTHSQGFVHMCMPACIQLCVHEHMSYRSCPHLCTLSLDKFLPGTLGVGPDSAGHLHLPALRGVVLAQGLGFSAHNAGPASFLSLPKELTVLSCLLPPLSVLGTGKGWGYKEDSSCLLASLHLCAYWPCCSLRRAPP